MSKKHVIEVNLDKIYPISFSSDDVNKLVNSINECKINNCKDHVNPYDVEAWDNAQCDNQWKIIDGILENNGFSYKNASDDEIDLFNLIHREFEAEILGNKKIENAIKNFFNRNKKIGGR